jgi:acetyltransferase-like isoleucine patch superfamily enzyme
VRAGGATVQRLANAVRSTLDPRIYLQGLKLLHYYNYSHVSQRRLATVGADVRLAPNTSLVNGERIQIGDRAQIGARCHLWAGNTVGRVIIGEDALFGPEVFLTASNYRFDRPGPVHDQPTVEADVVIGRDAWLGARVMVTAGVTVGEGCIVGAGAIVTRDLPAYSIAVGAPARVVGRRPGAPEGVAPPSEPSRAGPAVGPDGQPAAPEPLGPAAVSAEPVPHRSGGSDRD